MARRRLTLGSLSGDTLDVPRAEHAPAAPSPALLAHPDGPDRPRRRRGRRRRRAAGADRDRRPRPRHRPHGARPPPRRHRRRPPDPRPPPAEDDGDGRPCASRSASTASAPRSRSPPSRGALPYGLISGWRRLQALKALHAETGEPRFATVQALVRRPETAADAYVTMVEENEIRLGLSHYERARVAALATARGVFPTEDDALRALFATASRPKRSRIRAFLDIFHALDGVPALPRPPPRAPRPRPRRAPAHRRRRSAPASPPPSPRRPPTPPRPSSPC